MHGIAKNGRVGRRALAAAFLLAALLALAWMAPWRASAPDAPGVVRLAQGTPQPMAAASAVPRPSASRPPLTPQRNSELADENQYLVAREARDRAWADRSEAALLALLRGVAHVDARSLVARCTTSLCEVSGLAEEDPASGSMAPAWEALDRDTVGGRLSAQGLERDATTFGTGRVREAFMLYFRRTDFRR